MSRVARLGAVVRAGTTPVGPPADPTPRPSARRSALPPPPGRDAVGPSDGGSATDVPGRASLRRNGRASAAGRPTRAARPGRPERTRRGRPPTVGRSAPATTGDALRLLAEAGAALRAGATPDAAWTAAGVVVVDGVPEPAALASRVPSGAVPSIMAAARLARELGAPLAPVLDRVARSVERAGEAADRRSEALAGPRATATLLAWLPAAGPVLGLILGVDPVAVWFDGAGGTGLVLVGLGLTALGRGWTRRLVARAGGGVDPPAAGVLDLLDMALAAGADVPRSLAAVGAVHDAAADLVRVAGLLALGAGWEEAWAGVPEGLAPVAAALRPAWTDGVAAGPGLRSAAEAARRAAHTAVLESAGRLSVTIVLPLGLCHLPAFVAIGLVPVLVAMAGGTG